MMSHKLNVLLIALVAAALLAACGAQPATAPLAGSTPAGESLVPVIAVSELVVGANRLPLGILKNGTPINDPNLTLRLRTFHLDSPDRDQPRGEYEAVYRAQGLPAGLYVAYPSFDKAGGWAIEVQIPRENAEPHVSRMRVNVHQQPRTPAVGTPALPSKNLTARDMPDLKQLTSDINPDPELYQLTIAEAIAAKKPFLVAFSTPGYCQTAVCGPNLEVIKKLKAGFKDQINFIHIEVYPYPFGESFEAQRRVPAMDEWRLLTEPWTFLVDAQGMIQARYEGGITFIEMEPALKQLAAGAPIQP